MKQLSNNSSQTGYLQLRKILRHQFASSSFAIFELPRWHCPGLHAFNCVPDNSLHSFQETYCQPKIRTFSAISSFPGTVPALTIIFRGYSRGALKNAPHFLWIRRYWCFFIDRIPKIIENDDYASLRINNFQNLHFDLIISGGFMIFKR